MEEQIVITYTLHRDTKVRYKDIRRFLASGATEEKIRKNKCIRFFLMLLEGVIVWDIIGLITSNDSDYIKKPFLIIWTVVIIAMVLADELIVIAVKIVVKCILLRCPKEGMNGQVLLGEDHLEIIGGRKVRKQDYVVAYETEDVFYMQGLLPVEKKELSDNKLKVLREKWNGKIVKE